MIFLEVFLFNCMIDMRINLISYVNVPFCNLVAVGHCMVSLHMMERISIFKHVPFRGVKTLNIIVRIYHRTRN